MWAEAIREGVPIVQHAEHDIVRARKFELVDETGRIRAALGPGPEGQAGVQFYDEQGEPKIELSVSKDGTGQLWLRDHHGHAQAAIFTEGEYGASISLTSLEEGDRARSWGVALSGAAPSGDGVPRSSVVLSEGGSLRLVATLLTGGIPCILMYDEQGTEVWRQVGVPES